MEKKHLILSVGITIVFSYLVYFLINNIPWLSDKLATIGINQSNSGWIISLLGLIIAIIQVRDSRKRYKKDKQDEIKAAFEKYISDNLSLLDITELRSVLKNLHGDNLDQTYNLLQSRNTQIKALNNKIITEPNYGKKSNEYRKIIADFKYNREKLSLYSLQLNNYLEDIIINQRNSLENIKNINRHELIILNCHQLIESLKTLNINKDEIQQNKIQIETSQIEISKYKEINININEEIKKLCDKIQEIISIIDPFFTTLKKSADLLSRKTL